MVEKALQEKEEENVSLRRQLRQYEGRWSEYEAKMRSMEEMWQKQLMSLQVIFFRNGPTLRFMDSPAIFLVSSS